MGQWNMEGSFRPYISIFGNTGTTINKVNVTTVLLYRHRTDSCELKQYVLHVGGSYRALSDRDRAFPCPDGTALDI